MAGARVPPSASSKDKGASSRRGPHGPSRRSRRRLLGHLGFRAQAWVQRSEAAGSHQLCDSCSQEEESGWSSASLAAFCPVDCQSCRWHWGSVGVPLHTPNLWQVWGPVDGSLEGKPNPGLALSTFKLGGMLSGL